MPNRSPTLWKNREVNMLHNSFYHLTRSKSLKGFVATTDRRRRKGKYHVPLECKTHGGEAPDARICIAPTVWQCLISTTDTHTRYIYQLACEGVIRPSPENGVLDSAITDEHWITDDVIGHNQGLIPVKRVGFLKNESLQSAREMVRRWKDDQPDDPRSLNELDHLWIVDRSVDPSEWRLRVGVGAVDGTEEFCDEFPLEPPRWDWR
jgi:hypothetical protein